MEVLVIFVVAVSVLGVFANRLGCDSRSSAYCPEEMYSQLGLVWDGTHSELNQARQDVKDWGLNTVNSSVVASMFE